MKKKTIDLSRLLLVCMFAFMMGILLFPQTASAADKSDIYWAVTTGDLVISDQEVHGTTENSFPADSVFDENSAPWGKSIETVKIQGAPAPLHTDYWFSGCDNLKTVNFNGLDLSECVSMKGMLNGCKALQILAIYPGGGNISDDNKAVFPTLMYRLDSEKGGEYKEGALVPDYIPSDAGLNIYVINWSDLSGNVRALVKVLRNMNALSFIENPDELQDVTENAQSGYNLLSEEMKEYVPAEALAALKNAGGDELPYQIKVKWSSIDGVNLVEPFTFPIPKSGITVRDFLRNQQKELAEHFKKDGYTMFLRENYWDYAIGFNPMTDYDDVVVFQYQRYPNNIPDMSQKITDFTVFYFYSYKSVGEIELTVDPLLCGTAIDGYYSTNLKVSGENADKINDTGRPITGNWTRSPEPYDYINDTVKGGQNYYIHSGFNAVFGYCVSGMDLRINGAEVIQSEENTLYKRFIAESTADHVWDAGKVTKEATTEEEGIMTYTCTKCDEIKTEPIPKLDPENVAARENLEKAIEDARKITKDNYTDESFKELQDAIAEAEVLAADPNATTEQLNAAADKIKQAKDNLKEKNTEPVPGSDPNQMGADGTAVGPGASAAAAEKAITNMVSDSDPQGTVFGKLALKSPKQTKTSIDLSWNMVPGASSYVIYGNRCGKGIKPVKLAVVNSNKQTVSTIASQKVIKGTYYKFIAVALDKNNNVVSTSKVIHVATKGGKVGNHKKVTVSKSVIKKAKKLKKGKTLKLKAKAVPQSKKLKVKKHRAVLYESSNINIATVSKKGVVKAKSKGTCYVYAYAQNGVFKKIKVTVK